MKFFGGGKNQSAIERVMNATKQLSIAIIFVCVVDLDFQTVHCERVLAIETVKGKSHWNVMQGVLRALTNHGHQVTVFTPFPEGNRENYTEIDISEELKSIVRLDIDVVHKKLTSYTDIMTFVYDYSREYCRTIYNNNVFRKIIDDTESKFDVIMIEYGASECPSYLSSKLNVPLIYINPSPISMYGEKMTLGLFANPSYVAHTLLGHSVPRTFRQRFQNTILWIYSSGFLRFKIWYSRLTDRHPFDMIEPVKPSVFFSNAYLILDHPRPMPPNVIQVGGIHLNPPKKIPDDILEFVENSPNGVIVFTLGSIVAIASLPEHVKEVLFSVLGQLPQRVLLKYEDEMANIPKNIMMKKWFPQRDILLHPNVKLFVSHGGISGMYEAVDAGVPILGFPIFYDQYRNLANLVDAGMAISMDLLSLSMDGLSNAISELLNTDKYSKNAKIVSELFKDRPMTPEQAVDYWTRYVVRNKGAPHLKSHALTLPFYQHFLLDVLAVLLIVFLFCIFVLYVVIKFVFRYFNKMVSSKIKSKYE